MSGREESGGYGGSEAVREQFDRARRWYTGRPAGGATLVLLGALVIGYLPAKIALDVNFNTIGLPVVASLLCAFVLVFVALGALVRPEASGPLGVAAMALSAAALVALFGGLVVGSVLSGVGGLLCYAWTPAEEGVAVSESASDG
jgi:hypothetical protein